MPGRTRSTTTATRTGTATGTGTGTGKALQSMSMSTPLSSCRFVLPKVLILVALIGCIVGIQTVLSSYRFCSDFTREPFADSVVSSSTAAMTYTNATGSGSSSALHLSAPLKATDEILATEISQRSKIVALNPNFMDVWIPYNPSLLFISQEIWQTKYCPKLLLRDAGPSSSYSFSSFLSSSTSNDDANTITNNKNNSNNNNSNNNNNNECYQTRNQDIIIVTLFTKRPKEPFGSTVWMGVTSLQAIQRAATATAAVTNQSQSQQQSQTKQRRSTPSFFHYFQTKKSSKAYTTSKDTTQESQGYGRGVSVLSEHDWIVQPHMLPNVLGPKAADPRLFLLGPQNDVAFVAYSAINLKSSIPGMRDYHVRMGVVTTQARAQRDQQSDCAEKCPPEPPIQTPGAFLMNCTYSTIHCRDQYQLMGVEVHRDALNHVPQKNLQPIMVPSTLVAHFVDFSPPTTTTATASTTTSSSSPPVIYTVHAKTGALVSKTTMKVSIVGDHDASCLELKRGEWRGSTQILPFSQPSSFFNNSTNNSTIEEDNNANEDNENNKKGGVFVTIVHARVARHKYQHRFLFMTIDFNEDDYGIQSFQCMHLSSEEVFQELHNGFFFAVGLAQLHSNDNRFMVSFGRDDRVAMVQEIALSIHNKPLAISSSSSSRTSATRNSSSDKNSLRLQNNDTRATTTASAAQLLFSLDEFSGIIRTRQPNLQFFTYLDTTTAVLKSASLKRFQNSLSSIRHYHPGASIHLFIIPPFYDNKNDNDATTTPVTHFLNDLDLPFINIIVLDKQKLRSLLQGTPAAGSTEGPFFDNCQTWEQRSILMRLAVLWRWGGSWIDLYSIFVFQALPSESSNIVFYVDTNGTRTTKNNINVNWMDLTGTVDGSPSSLHFQNDALLNFVPGNHFLESWMKEILVNKVKNSTGCQSQQVDPSTLFLQNPHWSGEHLTLMSRITHVMFPGEDDGLLFPGRGNRKLPRYNTMVQRSDFRRYFQHYIRKIQPQTAMVHLEGCARILDREDDKPRSSSSAQEDQKCLAAWIAAHDVSYIEYLVSMVLSVQKDAEGKKK